MTENPQPAEEPVVEAPVSTGLFSRIFSWKKISAQNAKEVSKLNSKIDTLNDESKKAREELAVEIERNRQEAARYAELKKEYEQKLEALSDVKGQLAAQTQHSSNLNDELERNRAELSDVRGKLEAETAHASTLNVELEKNKIELTKANESVAAVQKKEEEENTNLLSSWKNHKTEVAEKLRELARKYDIIQIERTDYPLAGDPENIFLFSKQYSLFDTMSPESLEALPAFSKAVREHADEMKKYFKSEEVRRDAYIVVPLSAVSSVDGLVYEYPEYTIHVITPDSLLPIVQMHKSLEAYDFANEMAKEGRDKLCDLVAKLSYASKKKMQVDAYFSREVVGVLKEINTLPPAFTKDIEDREVRVKSVPLEQIADKVIQVEDEFAALDSGQNKFDMDSAAEEKTIPADIAADTPADTVNELELNRL